jgi:hypothetical protein
MSRLAVRSATRLGERRAAARVVDDLSDYALDVPMALGKVLSERQRQSHSWAASNGGRRAGLPACPPSGGILC